VALSAISALAGPFGLQQINLVSDVNCVAAQADPNLANGAFIRTGSDSSGNLFVNQGLWGIAFGSGSRGADSETIWLSLGGFLLCVLLRGKVATRNR
jgi:hypothetical protein